MTNFSEEYLFWVYSAFFICIVGFSLLLNTILLKFVKTLGIRNNTETIIRWSSVSKPALGGITFYIIFLISLGCYAVFFEADDVFQNASALGLIGATSIAFLMGLADDAYDTKPLLKFGVQVLCGVLLIASDNYIQLFAYEIINYFLTIFWVVGIMNSINMLDNMDGITSLVSSFILITIMMYMYLVGETFSFEYFLTLGVLGSLVGFLFFNWHPSKMFMGDTGSQFLGMLLAALSIKFLWNSHGTDDSIVQSRQVILVLLTFMLPVVDTTIVSINRIKRGQSPFVGGKDHTTHNLSYLGLSDSQVGFVFMGLAAVAMFLSMAIVRFLNEWNHYHTLIFSLFFIVVFGIFYYITIINKDKNK